VKAVEQRALERPAEVLHAAESRDAHGLAVKGVFEGNEDPSLLGAVLLPILQRELHRDLDCRRAVVAVEDVFQTGGSHLA
jgi:hypothetical protein